ncbi:MAG: methylcobalamin:coenzyme M methyltransferase [Lentisphaerae bacterium ADurb.BinA184]|nr:MAG: methylcobalamin:coenzyme M methyltransferase [Lentisphaerae bacterium ADurb.BinA184]
MKTKPQDAGNSTLATTGGGSVAGTYRPDYVYPNNEEKRRLLELRQEGRAPRVLCGWAGNSRIVVLDPALNPEGFSYEQMLNDPTVPPIVQSRFQEYWHTTIAETCDRMAELPAEWEFSVEYHNVYDAAYFGVPVQFTPNQVPGTPHGYLRLDDLDAFMAQDIGHPLDNPYVKRQLAFREEIVEAARDFSYLGRKGRVAPFTLGFDGPLTAAFMLFGEEIFMLMATEPEKARSLFLFITEACIIRNQALRERAGQPAVKPWGDLADDAIAMVSTEMLENLVLPAHELWFSRMTATTPADRRRGFHCCGDGTRHFKTMANRLGISHFDTGFPVDHGALRRELGPEIAISGGPHIGLFTGGTPAQLFNETRRILLSGVKRGRKFGLREGNNLPPCVPLENLKASYQACIEHGSYGTERHARTD